MLIRLQTVPNNVLFFGPLPLAGKGPMNLTVSRSVCQYVNTPVNSFSQNRLRMFSEILHEIRQSKGSKTEDAKFSRDIFILGTKSQNSSRIGFFSLFRKFNALMYFWPKMVHNSLHYDSAKTPCLGKICFFNSLMPAGNKKVTHT